MSGKHHQLEQQQPGNAKENLKPQHEEKDEEQLQQQHQHHREQHHHHMHCAYETDDSQLHQHHHQHQHHFQHQHLHQQEQKRQQTHEHFEEQAVHYAAEYSLPFQHAQQQEQQLQQQQQQKIVGASNQSFQRKHSHSHSHSHTPHHSRRTSPRSRHTSPHSRHSSPHSRHVSPHSRHTSPHSRHHSPHSRHTSPHSCHTSPHNRHTPPQFGHSHERLNDPLLHSATAIVVDPLSRNLAHRTSLRSTISHSHAHQHHAHHHRRRRHQRHHQQQTIPVEPQLCNDENWSNSCVQDDSRMHRHRSNIDVSNASLNANCQNSQCANNDDRQEDLIMPKVSGSCNSRTEIAQYFAEDLYGTTSRRPSSCCTSSDYCYQTDSTSLYGSRSSLSRNNSIKSAAVIFRQKKYNKREPSYTSLAALNTSRPNSNMGSLSSIFNRGNNFTNVNGKSNMELQSSKGNINTELPQYACSPSPIRWSFLADGKSPTESLKRKSITGTDPPMITNGYQHKDAEKRFNEQQLDAQEKSTSSKRSLRASKTRNRNEETPTTSRKCCNNTSEQCEESTMVQFHQEGEPYNNCCSNYIQCNTYLDQDLQITSEDIHQYLSKGSQKSGNILNNAKTYPFQPSNALEFQYKNNFANNNNQVTSNTLSSVEGAESMQSYDSRFRRNINKKTNINQNVGITETCMDGTYVASSCGSGATLSPTNINLSSSTNNINIVFSSCLEHNTNEVKFINKGPNNTQSQHMGDDGYIPINYPTYDFTNMSTSSIFDKPLGIDELPKEFGNMAKMADNGSSSQHSSSLQSPEPNQMSLESFDACSNHNLLSRQGSCHYSSTPRTPRSLNSPTNSSTYSISVNPVSTSYTPQVHYDYPATVRHQQNVTFNVNDQQQHQQHSTTTAATSHRDHRHHYHHHHHHHQQHNSESFKLSNAFKKVRKRARKYTDFLRKK